MSIETQPQPEQPQQQQETQTQSLGASQQSALSLQEIQLQALCNWCRNPLVMSNAQFTESNFVDTGKTWHGGSAQAVYCDDCINIDFRKNNPKSVIDRTNLEEANIQDLQ